MAFLVFIVRFSEAKPYFHHQDGDNVAHPITVDKIQTATVSLRCISGYFLNNNTLACLFALSFSILTLA